MRLGVFSDLLYRRQGATLSTHQAFIRFVASLPPRVEEVVLFGRLDPEPGTSHYRLPDSSIRFVEIPHYPRITAVAAQLTSLRRARRIFLQALEHLDAVWIFGPHPLAVAFALAAQRDGTPLILGVRQDYPRYIEHRLPSAWWLWAVPVAHGLEASFRLLARRAPTVALGGDLARRYAGGAPVLETGFSLVSRADLASPHHAMDRSWDQERTILSVGRLDAEKNPLLLADVLASLRAADRRWRLTIVGDGPLRQPLEAKLAKLGLWDAVTFRGYVENGPPLWAEYAASHVFLHVSLTEGLPQVLVEAQASGIPIVASAVGGVRLAIEDGVTGLLVPPDDSGAAVAALDTLARDVTLRGSLIVNGLAAAADQTMETQLDRTAAFLEAAVTRARPTA